jgi:hypothetical protein
MNLSLEFAVIVADRTGRSTMPSQNSLDERSGLLTSPVVLCPRITRAEMMESLRPTGLAMQSDAQMQHRSSLLPAVLVFSNFARVLYR